jgi:ferredoxin-NADP reductase
MAEAGCHIELRFGGSGGYFLRHYSVVGPLSLDAAVEPFWRIAVQREDQARGSAHIHASLRRGTRVKASRPIGAFRLARNLPHVLLIAGGIGITPILPMMRSLVVRRQSFSMLKRG